LFVFFGIVHLKDSNALFPTNSGFSSSVPTTEVVGGGGGDDDGVAAVTIMFC
jgi:hypothetical protein